MSNQGFYPMESVTVAPGGTTANRLCGEGTMVLLSNIGTVTVYVKFGTGTIAATAAAGIAVPAGVQSLVRVPEGSTHIAYITDSATGSLNIVSGYWK